MRTIFVMRMLDLPRRMADGVRWLLKPEVLECQSRDKDSWGKARSFWDWVFSAETLEDGARTLPGAPRENSPGFLKWLLSPEALDQVPSRRVKNPHFLQWLFEREEL